MCHSIENLPINETYVSFKKGRLGWKSQAFWPSIKEISIDVVHDE
jgi:hypothetical protein